MNLREMVAEIEHEQWVHWTVYMLDNLTPENIERWRRQTETPYSELSEEEKDSDRKWADRILSLPVGPEMERECPECEGSGETDDSDIDRPTAIDCPRCTNGVLTRRMSLEEEREWLEQRKRHYLFLTTFKCGYFVLPDTFTDSEGNNWEVKG